MEFTGTGQGNYYANGASLRYDIVRLRRSGWMLRIWTTKTAAGVTVRDQIIKSDSHESLKLARFVATEYETLEEKYGAEDYDNRERYRTAIERAYYPTAN